MIDIAQEFSWLDVLEVIPAISLFKIGTINVPNLDLWFCVGQSTVPKARQRARYYSLSHLVMISLCRLRTNRLFLRRRIILVKNPRGTGLGRGTISRGQISRSERDSGRDSQRDSGAESRRESRDIFDRRCSASDSDVIQLRFQHPSS